MRRRAESVGECDRVELAEITRTGVVYVERWRILTYMGPKHLRFGYSSLVDVHTNHRHPVTPG